MAVGSELTTGETRDTSTGELARALAGSGVDVRRIVALPDDLAVVTGAFGDALFQFRVEPADFFLGARAQRPPRRP